ncbi:MAG: proton-conducting transporter membrane subunit [Brevefilum sp.]
MEDPITFSISLTGVLLFAGLLLALAAIYWVDRKDGRPLTTYASVLVHLSLSSGFLALMSGQFMIRYIALDLVGLFVALSILTSFKESQNVKKFISVFQILRLGDLCLLVSILLINADAGTLDITRMISAAAEMPEPGRTWVLLGFVFAILIKLGIWPLGIWQRHTRETVPVTLFWLSGFLMPVLGFYLLYRIVPIVHAAPFFQDLVLFVSFGLFLLIVFLKRRTHIGADRFLHTNGLLGCLVLAAATMQGTRYLGYYLLGLVAIRTIFIIYEEQKNAMDKFWLWLSPLVLNTLFLWVNTSAWSLPFMIAWIALNGILIFWLWLNVFRAGPVGEKGSRLSQKGYSFEDLPGGLLDRSAGWISQKLETGVLSNGFFAMADFFGVLASWLHDNFEGGFEKGWTRITQWVMRASEVTLATVEVKPAQKTDDFVDGALDKLASYERNVLKKTLRWDLALIPLFLVAIIVLLFVV